MAKPSATATERPKSVDTLIGITEMALAYRYTERNPTLSDVARTVAIASRLLRYSNLDEKIEVENAAVLGLVKKRGLVG
jgi:hypothetical protein